jgi:CubicO group peptidase (beta-lactamase class C family)
MKHLLVSLVLIISLHQRSKAQLYFPPLTGNAWDTMSPSRLGWCKTSIDSLYNYLEQTHTRAFIVLKDGKIVLEKYFGSFVQDSVWYWASAGKSLMSFIVGIAQDQGILDIQQTVTHYLGTGWTVAPVNKESMITLRNLLTMTSGLDDSPSGPCENESPETTCLQYLADTGQRWAYHTGAYQQLSQVIEQVSGQTINQFTNAGILQRTGMTGLWFDGVFYSKARTMARFGLLNLSRGIWNGDTILRSPAYFGQMTNTSQNFNKSYGYLWWLNGKPSYMVPQVQVVFPGPLIPHAPPDMFAALGKNDQKIYVVPSENLVVVRMGDNAYSSNLALTNFDDSLWQKLDSLDYHCTYRFKGNGDWNNISNWDNNEIPPAVLAKQGTILIDPVPGGACILTGSQVISADSKLRIINGKKLRVPGNLLVQ